MNDRSPGYEPDGISWLPYLAIMCSIWSHYKTVSDYVLNTRFASGFRFDAKLREYVKDRPISVNEMLGNGQGLLPEPRLEDKNRYRAVFMYL